MKWKIKVPKKTIFFNYYKKDEADESQNNKCNETKTNSDGDENFKIKKIV